MSLNEKMTAIADAIRNKTKKTELLTLDDMVTGVSDVYDTGYDKGKTDFGVLATEKGTSIRIDHINDAEDVVNVKLSSKNILPYPYVAESQTTPNGLTITINDDGSVTFNGETTADFIYLCDITSSQNIVKIGKTYTQSLRYADGSIVPATLLNLATWADWLVGDYYPYLNLASGNDKTFTVTGLVSDDGYKEHQMLQVAIQITGGTYDNVTVYPQIEENTTATPYTPYVADVTSANVMACGVNMFDLAHMKNNNVIPSYLTPQYTENSFSFTGTADGAYQMISPKQKFYATGNITISGNGGWRIVVQPRDREGNYLENAYPITIGNNSGYVYLALYHGYYANVKHDTYGNFALKLTIPDEVAYFTIAFVMNAQTYTYTNFQIEVGHTVSAYTPYVAESIDTTYVVGELEQGSFDPNSGSETATTKRVRTEDYVTLPSGTYNISSTANVYIVMYVYDLKGNFIASESKVDWITSNAYSFALVGDRKVRFAFRFPLEGDILPSDVTDVNLICTDTITYTPNADGTLEIPSFSPTMTLMTDKQGVNIECEYYQDGQAVIDELTNAILNLGGTI